MTCSELAHSFFLFANEGKRRKANLTKSQVKRLNALMQTCGFMMSQVSLPYKGTRQSGIMVVL
jgi:glutaminase